MEGPLDGDSRGEPEPLCFTAFLFLRPPLHDARAPCAMSSIVSPGRRVQVLPSGPIIVTLFRKSLGRLSEGSQDEVILPIQGESYIQWQVSL